MTEVTRFAGQQATAEDVIAALERDGGGIIEDFLAKALAPVVVDFRRDSCAAFSVHRFKRLP